MIHTPTWVNLKNIMLREWSQIQKTIYCMVSFTWNVQKKQIDREGRSMVAWSWGWGHMEWFWRGLRKFCGGDKYIHSLNVVIGWVYKYQNVPSRTLKHLQFIVYQLYIPERIKWGNDGISIHQCEKIAIVGLQWGNAQNTGLRAEFCSRNVCCHYYLYHID